MKIYQKDENRFDSEGIERDGKHVFPFGYLIYVNGRVEGGTHDILGEVKNKIHKTKDGKGFFFRFHFGNENSALKEAGIYEVNLEGFFLTDSRECRE